MIAAAADCDVATRGDPVTFYHQLVLLWATRRQRMAIDTSEGCGAIRGRSASIIESGLDYCMQQLIRWVGLGA